MVGKIELCALSEEDLGTEGRVNLLRDGSRVVLQSLLEILLRQPEMRKVNVSHKRKAVASQSSQPLVLNPQSTAPPASLDLPKSTAKAHGIIYYCNADHSGAVGHSR